MQTSVTGENDNDMDADEPDEDDPEGEAEAEGEDNDEEEKEEEDAGLEPSPVAASAAGEGAVGENEATPAGRKKIGNSSNVQRGPQKQCVLIVTRNALGKRVRLSEFKVMRRGQRGIKAVKVFDDDAVAALSVVPDDVVPKMPTRPKEAWQLHQESISASLPSTTDAKHVAPGAAAPDAAAPVAAAN